MQLGMIGLGKMGANMSERLVKAGHQVVGYDLNAPAVAAIEGFGATGATSIEHLVGKLAVPRAVWMMVPAGDPVDQTLDTLLGLLAPDDVIVDGGNSNYKDTQRRAVRCREAGLHYLDAGTSGGIWGLSQGYSLMVGGDPVPVGRLRPIFEALAPGPEQGWGHVGPGGAGHFTKMIHNGIEYGVMQAYAEGFALLKAKQEFGLDLHQIAEVWRYGSVIRSWLLDLTSRALADDPEFSDIAPYVADSGEGRWTVFESIDLNVPAPVIGLSLITRIGSRDEAGYSDRLLAAMRHQFGGHATRQERAQ